MRRRRRAPHHQPAVVLDPEMRFFIPDSAVRDWILAFPRVCPFCAAELCCGPEHWYTLPSGLRTCWQERHCDACAWVCTGTHACRCPACRYFASLG